MKDLIHFIPLMMIAGGILALFKPKVIWPTSKTSWPRITGFILYCGIGIFLLSKVDVEFNNILHGKRSSFHESKDRNKTIISRKLQDDFDNATRDLDSILTFDQWTSVLNISGVSNAEAIAKQFNSNEVKAAKRFQGSWIITGTIQSIDDGFSDATVSLGKGWMPSLSVVLNDKEEAVALQKGKTGKFYCKSIEEAATMIFGLDCENYTAWADKAFGDLQAEDFEDLPGGALEKVAPIFEY